MGTTCGICGHGYEDVLHVLGDCTMARVSNSRIHKSARPSMDPSLQNNWIRLNMDGAVRAEDTFATAGRLKLFLDRGIDRVLIQTDNIEAIKTI
ncbi:hypothetical protein Gohar_015552 [Gossypium harknessii]|uniref:RNase H type-1 domain-containing protein n=1 Tax=Gossypium harknessii TaxID=34285 RepID=A0A7J9G038_9ROSI|nr:hypothetical protein [Gossypium harknessii]